MCGRETVRVGRASRAARTVDVTRSQILAECDHSATGVERVAEGRSGCGCLGGADATIAE